ncbi:hypothetical protein [Aliidiomarina soli]|uniref:C-type lysozyme inhibitor domain-containing protein n=1 Tax=Aliidiomarina soli TaxID=1928574 RepID=A0A432WJE4_9GAMM|nr:hypothetical protein [Aliidiomarina soli]RUO33946.1 hypothetical protein CWE14_05710 [Aliidiomarina soli]
MKFKRLVCATITTAVVTLISGCQQTPTMDPTRASERAAFSEWNCDGEPVLAQFYGARVVISDSSSSHWLDRGTQVGKVFRAENHSFRFRGDTATWTRLEQTRHCTERALPGDWQQAISEAPRNQLHYMAQGANEQWQFKLQGNRVLIELQEAGEAVERRNLPAGEADYYLDMWTYNVQTREERMRVQITDGLCRRAGDPTPYPSSIQINWNDQVLQGCGRWLAKSGHRP